VSPPILRACLECTRVWVGGLSCACGAPGEPLDDASAAEVAGILYEDWGDVSLAWLVHRPPMGEA
jgi:hypothetical protein